MCTKNNPYFDWENAGSCDHNVDGFNHPCICCWEVIYTPYLTFSSWCLDWSNKCSSKEKQINDNYTSNSSSKLSYDFIVFIAVIVGGVVGGIILISLIIYGIYWYFQKQ